MDTLAAAAKISQKLEASLQELLKTLLASAVKGDLLKMESDLNESVTELYNNIAKEVLVEAALESEPVIRAKAKGYGFRKLEWRMIKVQVRTGHYVEVPSLYAYKVPARYKGTRHLHRIHWKLLKGATPGYYSVASLLSVMCPSFEVAGQVLGSLCIAHNRERLRELSNALARLCQGRQAVLTRRKGESLAGKRVLIGIDGGRTRTRVPNGKVNAAGNGKYETPWVEPKMFVIDVLDEEGNMSRYTSPIYGCEFDADELFGLLSTHLKGLNIELAASVQIAADGAPWIWNRAYKILCGLGVPEERITQTVDYYHAAQYVHKIVGALPKKSKEKAGEILKEFKEWLWEGKIEEIVKKCNQLFRKKSKEVAQYIGYLSKNMDRMRYVLFRSKKLVCGSGIIESAIRRVINLRFKNASAFWNPENVKGLFFLRGMALAFRWNTLIINIVEQGI
jgi:hypothetical protein